MANASALTITSRQKPFTMSESRCTSRAVAVTNTPTSTTTASVAVSSIDTTGCAGKTVVVTVYDPTVTPWSAARRLEATGAVTTASATLTASSGTFTPALGLKVLVKVGGWQVPATWTYTPPSGPVNICQVRNSDGSLDSSKPCTVTGPVKADYWGSSGSGQGNFRTSVSAPGILNTQYVSFTVTLSGAPSWWSWSNAGLTRINNSGVVTSSCSTLPTFSGRLGANIGAAPDVYVDIVENRTGASGLVCQVP